MSTPLLAPWRVTALGNGRELLFIEATEAKATRRREILREQGFTVHMEKAIFGEPLERTVHIDEAIFGVAPTSAPESAKPEPAPAAPAERTSPKSTLAQLVSVLDIAEMLQVTRQHVRERLVKRAGFPLPAINERGMRRWRREAVERWIRRQEELSQRGLATRRELRP